MITGLKVVLLLWAVLVGMSGLLTSAAVNIKRGTDNSSIAHDYAAIGASLGLISATIMLVLVLLILFEKNEHDVLADRYKKLSHALGIVTILILSIFSILAYERITTGKDKKTNDSRATETLICTIVGFSVFACVLLYSIVKVNLLRNMKKQEVK